MKKYVIEFGVRGGNHAECNYVDTQKSAASWAMNLIHVFNNGRAMSAGQKQNDWLVSRQRPRVSWQSDTHFVSVSYLDGIMRGPASATLWKKPTQE